MREFRFHVLWKKKKRHIPCTFAISCADFEEVEILGLGFCFVLVCCWFLFCFVFFPEKYFQGDSSVKFRIFF